MDSSIIQATENFLSVISAKQEEYFKSGKYWQGLKTCDAIPDITDKASEIKCLDDSPRANVLSWREMGLDNLTLPFQAEVHEYQAPGGSGYRVILRISRDGKDYLYIQSYGVESYTQDWTEDIIANQKK